MKEEEQKYISRLFDLIPDKASQQIADKLESVGCKASRTTVDRIINGKRSIKLDELLNLCDVYHLDLFQVFDNDKFSDMGMDFCQFICDPDAEEFKGYLGEYNCWYHSTAIEEYGELIEGKLILQKTETKAKYCQASVLLSLKNGNTKIFTGKAMISKSMQAVWILLTEEDKGDFASIILRYRKFNEECVCRIGFVLTVGAGEYMRPVIQKIFLSRQDMPTEFMANIASFLKFDIVQPSLSKEKWEEWKIKYSSYANEILAKEELTYNLDLHNIIKNSIPQDGLYELLEYSQNSVLHRLNDLEDSLSYMLSSCAGIKGVRCL